MPKSLVTAPVDEPVTVDEARENLRVTDPSEDALIGRYITAARQWAEGFLQRGLLTQTWDQYFNQFTDEMRLELPPLQSVTSVKYLDTAGALQTLSASVYSVDIVATPGRIRLGYNQSWPSIRWISNAVVVRFVAGYQSTDSPPVDVVPEQIRQGILLLVEHLYDERGGDRTMPPAIAALLSPYRVISP